MSEEAIKKRLRDAKMTAMEDYKDRGYQVSPSDNLLFCFSATDKARTHECKVRVVIDKISLDDRLIMDSIIILPNQRKEIMCRPYRANYWIREVYDHLNNSCQ